MESQEGKKKMAPIIDTDKPKLPVPDFPRRPAKFNTQGKEVTVAVNMYNIDGLPTTTIHQYDVSFSLFESPCLY